MSFVGINIYLLAMTLIDIEFLVRFYNRNDMVKLHSIQNYKFSGNNNENDSKLSAISNYCSSNANVVQCRRRFLLNYFDDNTLAQGNFPIGTNCCDLCENAEAHADKYKTVVSSKPHHENNAWLNKSESIQSTIEDADLGHEILLFLHAVKECGGYFGLSAPVGVVTGSKEKSLHRIPGEGII